MRMQGNEQVVCQLLFAAWCRKIDEKWKWLAVLCGKAAKKATQLPGWPYVFETGGLGQL